MKKLLIGTSFLLGSFMAPSFAEEANDFYLSIGGGAAFPSDVNGDFTLSGTRFDAAYKTQDPFLYGIGLGKEFNDWRIEFNFSGAEIKSDKITLESGGVGASATFTPDLKMKTKNYMLYGYKDIKNDTKFTPYIGAGLGITAFKTDAQTITSGGTDVDLAGASKSVFSYGLKGGISYEISQNTILFSEISYLNAAKFKNTELGQTVNYDSNNWIGLTAGLRFNF